MTTALRFLGMLLLGLVAIIAAIMGFISTFMYKRYGAPTKKTIFVSGGYLALCLLASVLALVLWNPTYASVAVFLLALGGFVIAAYVGCSYFNLMLIEKGPHAMFMSIKRFVRKLLTHNH